MLVHKDHKQFDPSCNLLSSPESITVIITVDFTNMEHRCRMSYHGIPSFPGPGLKDGHVPTFWLLLQHYWV